MCIIHRPNKITMSVCLSDSGSSLAYRELVHAGIKYLASYTATLDKMCLETWLDVVDSKHRVITRADCNNNNNKLYFLTVKTWLQKVFSLRAVWLVKVSISIYSVLPRFSKGQGAI